MSPDCNREWKEQVIVIISEQYLAHLVVSVVCKLQCKTLPPFFLLVRNKLTVLAQCDQHDMLSRDIIWDGFTLIQKQMFRFWHGPHKILVLHHFYSCFREQNQNCWRYPSDTGRTQNVMSILWCQYCEASVRLNILEFVVSPMNCARTQMALVSMLPHTHMNGFVEPSFNWVTMLVATLSLRTVRC